MGNKCGSGQTQDTQEPKITVLVKGTYGLPDGDLEPGKDRFLYYAVGVESGGIELFESSKKQNVVDPVWNEECELPANGALKFSVFQADADGNSTVVAVATLDLQSASSDSFNGELPLLVEGADTGGVLWLKAKSGDEYAPDTSGEFNVTIENEKKKALGLEVDCMDPEKLYVIGIKKGSVVDIWNAEVDNKVEAGIFITGIEGPEVGSGGCLGAGSGSSASATQSAAMEKILKKNAKQVEMVCRKSTKFRIALTLEEKGGVGVTFPPKPVGNSLVVTEVKEDGPMNKWNTDNPEQTVEPMDRIIAVDGKEGKVADLQKHIKAAQQGARVILTLVRLAPAAAVAPADTGETAEEVAPEAGETS